jgi:microcystin-dependent protein
MSARNSYNVAPIPGDNNGGSGGGDGPSADGGLPIGSVIPFAGATAPAKFLLCNGAEYVNDGVYEDLYNVIFFTYGVNPSIQVQTGVGPYSYAANTLTFNLSTANQFVKVGAIVRPAGFVQVNGQNINGTYVLVVSAPAIGATGSATGTFVQPITGSGDGLASGFGSVNRASFPVPDLRLASPIGAGTGIALASTGGSATTTITANNLPSHQHGLFQPGSSALTGSGQQAGTANVDANLRTIRGETYVEGSTESNGALVQNVPISTRNPYVAMNYIIHAET